MDEFEHVEFLPEPEDARILSAIDPAAVGFQGALASRCHRMGPT
jgi:hypothetical protein